MKPYVLGVPNYANTSPLYHFLREDERLRFRYGVPTELNAWLLEGSVDLSLVSAYFYLQHAEELRVLPDFSVAVLGRVYSVNLFHRTPWTALSRVALTGESATSVRLLQYLLELDGVSPTFERVEGGLELLAQADFDGVLLIGDRAIQAYAGLLTRFPVSAQVLPTRFEGLEVSDLSMRWFEHTRLPFVFALWATRDSQPPSREVLSRLREARRIGLGSLGRVAKRQAERLGIDEVLMQHYLWNFRYHFEYPDGLGFAAFAKATGGPHLPRTWDV